MASAYIEKRKGKLGMRYRAVLEWWVNGKPQRHKEKWTRYWKKANKKKQELAADAEDIRLGIKKRTPSKTWGELWREYKKFSIQDLQPATWSCWHRPTILHFTAYLNKHGHGDLTPVGGIGSELVTRFRYYLEDAEHGPGLARNTVAGYGRHLTAMFNYAISPLKWITENPCLGVPWPKSEPTGQAPAPGVVEEILKHSRERLQRLVWIDLQSGARSGELVNIHHQLLHRKDNYITIISHKRRNIRGGWKPKTKTSERRVPILPHLWPLFGPPAAEGPVFTEYRGAPGDKVRQVSKDFADARRRAIEAAKARGDHRMAGQLEGVTFHDLKHAFCTDYLTKNGTTAKLSEITGTSEATLKKTYSHLLGKVTVEDMAIISRGPLPKSLPKDADRAAVRGAGGRFSRRGKEAGAGKRPTGHLAS